MSDGGSAGGAAGDGSGGTGQGKEKDTVLYETHQKLLAQRKKDQEKLKSLEEIVSGFETEKKKLEEKKLNDDGEVRKILELRDKEIDELKTKMASVTTEKEGLQESINESYKLSAFHAKLPGKIKRSEYLNFVDTKKIAVDPETGNVDPKSVDVVVNSFMENYSDLVDTEKFKAPPGGAPYGTTKLTKEEWLKMPLKEQKKNVHRLVNK